MTGPPPLPLPPAVLPPIAPFPWTAALWRIQNGTDIVARTYPAPRYRFDAPHGEYPVLYACAAQLGTFAEVYGDRARRLGEGEGERYLTRLLPRAPLPLVDLTDVRLLASLGLDERISVGDDYATWTWPHDVARIPAVRAVKRAHAASYPASRAKSVGCAILSCRALRGA